MSEVVNVNQLLDGHVSLEIECLDRIYLNPYIPTLQVSGQVVTFLTGHRGYPIPSPALFAPIGNAFRAAVQAFAEQHGIPLVHVRKAERKIDRIRPLLQAAAHPGVVAIGVAQGDPIGVHRLPTAHRPAGRGPLRPARSPTGLGLLRPLDARLPVPLTPADRRAGYWWELSMRQIETSRTLVFTARFAGRRAG